MRVTLLVALMMATTVAAGPAQGRGVPAHWTMTRLDLDLVIDPASQRLEGERFPATSPVRAVRLDPSHRILRSEPEYAAKTGGRDE